MASVQRTAHYPVNCLTAEAPHLVRPLDPPAVRRTAAFAATPFSREQRTLAERIAEAVAPHATA